MNSPVQIPLDFAHDAGLSRDHLIVSAQNRAAVDMVEQWPAWPSPVVILAGPAGSGKTHLASIWREFASAAVGDAGHVDPSLIEGGGPVLIDDADRGPVDETGLFHLINAVRGQGRSMLLTARRFPSAWGVALPDLASRLKAATLVEMREPDDDLLAGVITKLFADRQVEVDPSVVQYMVRRMERSLSTASALVERLDRLALERKAAITRSLAAETISAMDEGQGVLDID